jgi:hypothetical protein
MFGLLAKEGTYWRFAGFGLKQICEGGPPGGQESPNANCWPIKLGARISPVVLFTIGPVPMGDGSRFAISSGFTHFGAMGT